MRAWWPSGWTLDGLQGLTREGKSDRLGNARVRAGAASELPGLESVAGRRDIHSSPPLPLAALAPIPFLPHLTPFLTSHRLTGQQLLGWSWRSQT